MERRLLEEMLRDVMLVRCPSMHSTWSPSRAQQGQHLSGVNGQGLVDSHTFAILLL